MTNAEKKKLVESLMRACYKAEVLNGKCIRAGVDGTGLEQAAKDFRAAAERVDRSCGDVLRS